MSSEHSSVGAHPALRRRFWWLRWVLLALVIAILAVEVVLIWPKLEQVWHRTGDLDWVWLVACIVAAVLSMDSFAQVQRALLSSAGVRVRQLQSLAVVLAANSLSQTMPGGQVLAPAFTYRETRKWGATPVVASWQVVMSGLLAGVGLAVLGFGGAVLAGAKTNPFSLMFSIVGFVAVALVLQYLATHPESLQSTGERVLGWYNHLRNKPEDSGLERFNEVLEQLRAVQLTRRDTTIAFGWSLFNWVTDIACLMFACWAVGVHPSISGVMVAYAAGKAVGTAVPLLPGGIGVVDAVLVPALTTAGMPAADALTAVLVYRIVSYVLIAAIGWVVILAKFRTGIRDKGELEATYDREREMVIDELEEHDESGTSDQTPRAEGRPDPPNDGASSA
ncbi:putative integral membrane protein [Gordonia polyisoprenivorans VH2]|uniref:Putative integral membrane protein n=1 Tax=Gordonia polyisoprenivorans (strain DSM 44266 / VH2) TaxID=1112204 RepID=H6MV45_GORPV|nr:YbhN family protein [Gordonia polyisoprenivorans]AFA71632.1 putative integral membrane protein [Gordonia polyisoprenivorans VH2]